MGLLKVIDDAPGFAKVSLQGPQGSGKSRTAVEIACFLHSFFKSTKPIAFYDTESGSDYLAQLIAKRTGLQPIRIKTRAFSQLLEATRECVAGASDILCVDSITHVWREIQASYMALVNRDRQYKKTRMDIGDIMQIKQEWEPWPDLFLNSPLHVIVCGREGNEWGHEENEDTGKRELVAVGKKMKVEGEFGYEASLMLSMHAEQIDPMTVRSKKKGSVTKQPRRIINVVTVLKDRFDELNGVRFEMPTGKDFLPFIKRLRPANHVAVDTQLHSQETLPEMDGGYARVKTDREILCEKIQAELVRAYPGQTAVEKKAKADKLDEYIGTRSWLEVERRIPVDVLRRGYQGLKSFVDLLEAARKEGAPVEGAPVNVEEQLNRVMELSGQVLAKQGGNQASLVQLYKEAAGVDTIEEVTPATYGKVIAALEAKLANGNGTKAATSTRRPRTRRAVAAEANGEGKLHIAPPATGDTSKDAQAF